MIKHDAGFEPLWGSNLGSYYIHSAGRLPNSQQTKAAKRSHILPCTDCSRLTVDNMTASRCRYEETSR
jgi:hypothetical protein